MPALTRELKARARLQAEAARSTAANPAGYSGGGRETLETYYHLQD